MKNFTVCGALKELNVSYLGGCTTSAKVMKSLKNGCLTYIIYLAPADLSGHNVCPNHTWCKELCLNGSGHNKGDILAHGKNSLINISRIKKTNAFYNNRETFMQLMIHEIKRYKKVAENSNLHFAVRINGTSDLSPELFKFPTVENGKNILEIFPEIQFYDYTKVASKLRLSLPNKYNNYDLTLSYNGHNWNECEKYLKQGGKIAVVFENDLPYLFKGYKVNNANEYDMRFEDKGGEICGLHYHRVAANYKDGIYIGLGNDSFVVKETDENCIWH